MTESEPDVTPEQEAQLRRLLREARHEAPVPDDVAARLDEVLARLGTDAGPRVDPPEEASVVDLSARRRRTAARLLVAAAAVVVAGAGIGTLVHHHDADESSGSAAVSSVPAGSMAPKAAPRSGPADDATGGLYGSQSSPLTGTGTGTANAPDAPNDGTAVPAPSAPGSVSRPTIRPATFAAQARTLRDRLQERKGRDDANNDSLARAAAGDRSACPLPKAGPGVRVVVSYQGRVAAVVVRPPAGASQVVDLLACGSGRTLRSVTLAAPSR